MGDVYQATDTKLGRSVAIKLLPEAFARNSERVAGFQREARVLVSINHPNIAAIYGVVTERLQDSIRQKFEPVLKAMTDPANQRVFLHSGNGHRTATLWMIKRVVVYGWSAEQAGARSGLDRSDSRQSDGADAVEICAGLHHGPSKEVGCSL